MALEQVDNTRGLGEKIYLGFDKVNLAIVALQTAITKLATIDTNAADDQTGTEIKLLLEALVDKLSIETGVKETTDKKIMTAAERTKLVGIETAATADLTGLQIVALLEALAGANRLDADAVEIADAGGYYTPDEVEGALQAVGTRRLENLCRNAAFTSRSGGTSVVPDEWELKGTPTVAYDTVDVGYGNFAIELTATGTGGEGIKVTLTHLKVSTKYQVFVRAKVTAGDTAILATIGATTNINEETTSTSYVSLTGEFITDGAATDVTIRLLAKTAGDIAFFCGITVVEGDIPPGNFIRRVNETIWLTTALNDTDFNGDGFSTSEADINLSAFGNGCPPKIKAVLVSVTARDAGSAAGNCSLMFGLGGIALATKQEQQLYNVLDGVKDSEQRQEAAWINCNSDGDIRYRVIATGAGTLDIWLYVWGYVLGE